MRTNSRLLSRIAVAIAATLVFSGLTIATTTAPAAADVYNPPSGIKLNNPKGSKAAKYAIFTHIVRSIRSVPRGGQIRIMTWNLRSRAAVDALLAANRRGVSVQVIIDRRNAAPYIANRDWRRLQRGLASYQRGRSAAHRSWAYGCVSACRGPGGLAHSKFFLFSQSQHTKWVSMHGSANLTRVAATNQWNDMFTVTNNFTTYSFLRAIFNEARSDRNQIRPYRVTRYGGIYTAAMPMGSAGDPILAALNKVRCTGTGTSGIRGRTAIRIGQTATLGARGERIMIKLKQLYNSGCDVKMIYAVMGNRVLWHARNQLKRGPVPLRHIAQDNNHDGAYDSYLHAKVMTISGNYNGRASQDVVFNGSSNWSGVSLVSDETFGLIYSRSYARVYSSWVDRWFNVRLPNSRIAPRFARMGIDPYRDVEIY